MPDSARFTAFRTKYHDPLLTALTLVLMVLLFLLVPLQAELALNFAPLGVAVTAVMIAGVYVLSGRWIMVVPVALAFALHFTLRMFRDHDMAYPHVYLIASLWLTLSLTFALVVARAVFSEGPVTAHRIVGAILLYLLVALIFASLFLFIGAALPGAFANLAIADSPRLAADVIYFSFVTLTSVGYGDIYPIHALARSLCNLESIAGQLFPAILIARLVSLHIVQAE